MVTYGSVTDSTGATRPIGTEETSPLLHHTKVAENGDHEDVLGTDMKRAGLWSKLVFGWMTPLFVLGNEKKELTAEDLKLLPLPTDCTTDFLQQAFDQAWKDELKKANPSLLRALFRAFGFDYLVGGFILKLIHDCCLFVGPQVLNGMVLFLKDGDAPIERGLNLTLVVTASQLLMSFCLRHYFLKCYLFGLRTRTAVVTAVYRKALVLAAAERQARTLGEITNLMSIDAQKLQDLTNYLHAIWYSFVQIALAIFFLWKQLGPSCLGGVAVIVIMIPVTKQVAMKMGGLQKGLMKSRDARVNVNSEVLGSMKVIKLQAWERPFQERISDLRNIELKQLWRYSLANALSTMLWSGTPLAVALATFTAYVMLGNNLDVATALTSLALFEIIRFPLFMLPTIINTIVEATVSLGRVRSFLLCDVHRPIGSGGLRDAGISMENLTAVYESTKPRFEGKDVSLETKQLAEKDWEISLLKAQLKDAEIEIKDLAKEDTKGNVENGITHSDDNDLSGGEAEPSPSGALAAGRLCLRRINFECTPGQLVAVVGGVGSGKSSLINAILGEMRVLAGTSYSLGKFAFFAQSPFILNASVKENILFSHVDEPVDEERYQRAIECCALEHDLAMLSAGDQTEIGEKGITLSGGQKARVALARAVYHQADLSLIDDALAAVDAHVAAHLFQKCIVGELMQGNGRSVILATNALQHLRHPRVDTIVVLRDGRVVERGSYAELSKNPNTEFSRFLSVIAETGVDHSALPEMDGKDPSSPVRHQTAAKVAEDEVVVVEKPEKKNSQLIKEEESAKGNVSADVYFAWSRAAGGVWIPFVVVVLYGGVEGVLVLSKWWLTYWSQHSSSNTQYYFLGIYALINLAAMLATFFRVLLLIIFGLRASRKLFEELLQRILHAPMSFFDTTPVGRIVNRFSKDMYTVDEQLMGTLRSFLATIFAVVSTIVVISGVTPIFTVCLIPVIIYYGIQQRFFNLTYRELKRLDSVKRSPIYALLGESIDGLATIRAFSAEKTLTNRMTSMLDVQQNAYFLTCVAQCWLAVRLEMVGTIIITGACLCALWEHVTIGPDERFAGLAGLSITYALSVTQSLNWTVRMSSDLEAAMVAVERVKEYCGIDNEAARTTEVDSALTTWPSSGSIDFQDVKLRYRPGLPLVLKGLTLRIPGGTKVGVVGRTGAGKSTLMLSLLRIVELDSGKVFIDGIDTSTMGLELLRSKIAVIPQDPVLFSGTIRTNLDPFKQYSDADLFEVLSRVNLFSSAKPNSSSSSLSSMSQCHVQSLEDPVREGGNNFSVGQRQLLVIARALLCGAGIVVMDEATAAVDADTDARIQKVMSSEFANATCITVAHRINTIMDSDYILVMDDGRAAEFDSPQKLLSKGGLFRSLVVAASKDDHAS